MTEVTTEQGTTTFTQETPAATLQLAANLDWTLSPGVQAWHDKRLLNVGGSEIASLFGLQSDFAMSAFTLWAVKSGRMKPPVVDDSPGTRVWRGKRLEPVLAQMAAEQFGWKIRYPGPYATDDVCPGAGASLDAVIEEPGEEETKLGFRGPGVLELKSSQYRAHKETWVNNEPPFQVLLQPQHGCMCAGFEWAAVVVDVSETGLICYRYKSRERTVRRLREAVRTFWKQVRDGTPPDPDATASTALALKEMFPPQVRAPTLDLTNDDAVDILALQHAINGENRTASNKAYDLTRNQMMWALKGVTQAETANCWISAEPNKNGAVTLRIKEKVRT